MSSASEILVDFQDELAGDDTPSNALDHLKLSPMEDKQWPSDDLASMSKSGKGLEGWREWLFFLFVCFFAPFPVYIDGNTCLGIVVCC